MPLPMRSNLLRKASLLILLVFLTGGCGGGVTVDGGAASLQWEAPDTYTDGNPIGSSDLKGYRVYYRIANEFYSSEKSYFVPAQTTNVSIQNLNLVPGKYYIVVTAVDVLGVESDFSNEIGKKIY